MSRFFKIPRQHSPSAADERMVHDTSSRPTGKISVPRNQSQGLGQGHQTPVSDQTARGTGTAHYRTHSSLAGSPPASAPGQVPVRVEVVRTPSDARRGIMKTRLSHDGTTPAGPRYGLTDGVSGTHGAQQSSGWTTLTKSTRTLRSAGQGSGSGSGSGPAPASKSGARVGSPDLPMMEESDRRISMPAPARRGIVKAPSMSAIGPTPQPQAMAQPQSAALRTVDRGADADATTHTLGHQQLPVRPRVAPALSTPHPQQFHARLVDVTQRPAASTHDDVLIRLEFGFSLGETSSKPEHPILLPLDVVRRAPGYLLDTVEDEIRMLYTPNSIRLSDGSDDPHPHSRSGQPSLTDGDTGPESDSESDYGYGPGAFLRDEYLQSLWMPDGFDLSADTPPPAVPTHAYPTQPKGRARVRNQYARMQPQMALPTPTSAYHTYTPPDPSAHAHLVLGGSSARTRSLALRRRATCLTLPQERGTTTEMTLLILRDGALWSVIVARIALGAWPAAVVQGGHITRERRAALCGELEWAGMMSMARELEDASRDASREPRSGKADVDPRLVRTGSATVDEAPLLPRENPARRSAHLRQSASRHAAEARPTGEAIDAYQRWRSPLNLSRTTPTRTGNEPAAGLPKHHSRAMPVDRFATASATVGARYRQGYI